MSAACILPVYSVDAQHDAFKQFVGPHLQLPIATGLIVIDFTSQ